VHHDTYDRRLDVDRREVVIAGRYTLEREIGRGATGPVWLGRDEVLGRRVALKRIGLLPGTDGTDLARAEREARLAARLNHPHVVAVFNVAVDHDPGAHWLVMEYVEGTTLGHLVQEHGALPPDVAAPLLLQAADALAAAHAAGIVHRDVKPSNILVGRDAQVKLTDFGIARITTDPALTQTGLVVGSPAYLAPEVAAGDRGDDAADVWSLGATVFHVLSGRPPYDVGDNVLGALYRIVNDEPPRPVGAGWLTPLLEGTMVKDPGRRWSMGQVRDFLAGPTRPGPDAGPSTRELDAVGPAEPRGRSGGPGRAAVLAALAAGLLALLVVLLVLVVRHDEPSAGRPPARPATSKSATSSRSSGSSSPSPRPHPTAHAMSSFVRDYVAAVSSDPASAWPMLTPKFQRESGGLDAYRRFWSGVGQGHVLDITADPDTLVVSYHVHFEHFGTGRRPTVLKLAFRDGHYLIEGERTQGFTPAD
jgi:serine/threonine protein kinase